MAGRRSRGCCVDGVDPTVERRDPEGDPSGLVGVGPENRGDKTAAALGDERNRIVEVLIAEEGRHRAERLDDVSGRRGRSSARNRVGAMNAPRSVSSPGVPVRTPCGPHAATAAWTSARCSRPTRAPMSVASSAGGDRDRLQSGDEGVADGVEVGVGHDHSRMAVHF